MKIPIADSSPTKPAALKVTEVPAAAALRRWLRHATEPHMLFPAIAVLALAATWCTTLNLINVKRAAAERAGRPPPTVIILDLKLPKLDGLGVLKVVRGDERTRLIPMMILTSSKEEQDLIQGYSLGANSYVRKPVDFAEFQEAVRLLGIYWLITNRPPPERPSA